MSKTMFIESNNRAADISAATQIIFEMEEGVSNKIIWQSNITKIVDAIYVGLDETLVKIDKLQKQIFAYQENFKNINDRIFELTDVVDKLEKKLRKNAFKIGDINQLLEDLKDDSMDDTEEAITPSKATSKQSKKYVRIRRRALAEVD